MDKKTCLRYSLMAGILVGFLSSFIICTLCGFVGNAFVFIAVPLILLWWIASTLIINAVFRSRARRYAGEHPGHCKLFLKSGGRAFAADEIIVEQINGEAPVYGTEGGIPFVFAKPGHNSLLLLVVREHVGRNVVRQTTVFDFTAEPGLRYQLEHSWEEDRFAVSSCPEPYGQ